MTSVISLEKKSFLYIYIGNNEKPKQQNVRQDLPANQSQKYNTLINRNLTVLLNIDITKNRCYQEYMDMQGCFMQ